MYRTWYEVHPEPDRYTTLRAARRRRGELKAHGKSPVLVQARTICSLYEGDDLVAYTEVPDED